MRLAAARVGPYLRALRAGLHALAPHDDYTPLRAMVEHLDALDPALSGELLFPAEVDDRSGLPAFTWMERAVAEQVVARQSLTPGGQAADDPLSARVDRLDPDLGRRMRWRRALHAHLRRARLVPPSRLTAVVRRLEPTTDFSLIYDRMLPGAGWMRLRVEMSGHTGWQGELLQVQDDGRVRFDPGLQHLLARHCVVPVLTLRDWLAQNLSVAVPRLARSIVGPFWFPGIALPERAPAFLRQGLVLQVSTEVLARDVAASVQRDPWPPSTPARPPPAGFGLFRERRFAVSPSLLSATRAWAPGCGVVALRPGRG